MPLDQTRNALWTLDCEQVEPQVAEELLRQAELRQAAIFQAALGMDQRAAVLSAGFIAAGGALAAAGLALEQANAALRAAAFTGAMLAAVAGALCAWACRPQSFRFPGIEPLDWASNPAYLREPLRDLRIARAALLQDHIASNEKQQKRNGHFITAGMLTAAAAPILATFMAWAWKALGAG